MPRLPEPGGDVGQWGDVLNEYLQVSHNNDGSIKNAAVSTSSIQDGAITVAKISTTGTPTNGQSLTYNGTDLTWATTSSSGSVPDATGSVKGVVQLSGDLGGTAASPTVPGLATKESTINPGTETQYYRGDKTWQTLSKTAVGLPNVDNTADAAKPISTATQTALDAKEPLISGGTAQQYFRGDKTWNSLDKAAVGLANVDNTSDANKPVSTATASAIAGKANATHVHGAADITTGTIAGARLPLATDDTTGIIQLAGDLGGTAASPTVPGLAGKEATITPGTTAQYYRGDKTWQTLNKAAVGLANVDNTTDAAKPVSTATQTALNGKANTTHVHSGEDITTGTVSASRLPVASDTATGVVELATIAETQVGTDTTRAVTAAGVKATVDAAVAAVPQPEVLFVDSLGDIPPGTPVDTLVVVRAA